MYPGTMHSFSIIFSEPGRAVSVPDNRRGAGSYCQCEGIAIEAYCSLTRGKKLSDPPLVLLRWAIQRGCMCIPRSPKEKRIVENAMNFDF